MCIAEVYLGFFLKGNSLSDVLPLNTGSILLFNLLWWIVERMTKSWTFYRNPRKERNELKFVELNFFFYYIFEYMYWPMQGHGES